ncbi:MAG: DegT/DnrJ/EryC1/StrS family aminotransferase [Calditrichota bacterium]
MSVIEKRSIQFIDLAAQQQRLRSGIEKRLLAVLDHGKYIMGPEIAELETLLADYSGVKHCISCANGTDALLMALMAYEVGPGDAVFTTPFTFISTAEVITLLGATPVFVDIDKDTYNIDPAAFEVALECYSTEGSPLKPRGVIPVDLFGLAADYNPIEKIAKKHGMFVLEDAAQGFGAVYDGRRAGSFGDVATTSFFPAKPLGCYGDGGAIFCDDDELAAKLVSIRVHGKGDHKYDNVRIGLNGRLDSMQAGVVLEKMTVFDEEIRLRNEVASRYTEALKDHYVTPVIPDGYTSVWAQYSIQTEDRDGVMAKLKERGVPTAIYYPKPLHIQDAFSYLGYKEEQFPVTMHAAKRIFSVPMHPYLQGEEQDYIISALLDAVK